MYEEDTLMRVAVMTKRLLSHLPMFKAARVLCILDMMTKTSTKAWNIRPEPWYQMMAATLANLPY